MKFKKSMRFKKSKKFTIAKKSMKFKKSMRSKKSKKFTITKKSIKSKESIRFKKSYLSLSCSNILEVQEIHKVQEIHNCQKIREIQEIHEFQKPLSRTSSAQLEVTFQQDYFFLKVRFLSVFVHSSLRSHNFRDNELLLKVQRESFSQMKIEGFYDLTGEISGPLW